MFYKLLLSVAALVSVTTTAAAIAGPLAIRPSTHVVLYDPRPYDPFANSFWSYKAPEESESTTGLDTVSGSSSVDSTTGVQHNDRTSSSTTGEKDCTINRDSIHNRSNGSPFNLRGTINRKEQ